MNPLLITGNACSGTGWVAAIIDALLNAGPVGEPACGHEALFHPGKLDWTEIVRARRHESSWLAAPHVHTPIMAGYRVVRVVRNPYDVYNSIYNDGFLCQINRGNANPYGEYAHQFLSILGPINPGIIDTANPAALKTALYVTHWDARLPDSAPTIHADRPIDAALTLSGLLGLSITTQMVARAVDAVGKPNTHLAGPYVRRFTPEQIDRSPFGAAVAWRAEELGYT